jgi:hypothetical protein
MFSSQFNFSLPIRDLSDFTGHYGASKLASSYCGLSKTRQVPGLWQHGPFLPNITSSQYIEINPGVLTDGDLHNFARSFWRYFVASREILFYLKSIDYKNVYAIGLPFIYVPEIEINEIEDSLLIFPGHSSANGPKRNFHSYENFIYQASKLFANVGVCLHNNDFNQININTFERFGVDMVFGGADEHDANSLLRIKYLLGKFETVVSDTFSSAVVYAAHLGKKIAISGPDVLQEKYLYDYIDDYNTHITSFQILADQELKHLRIHPSELKKARQHKVWADNILGVENKLSPLEMKSMFKYNSLGYLIFFMNSWRMKLEKYKYDKFRFN